MLTLRLYPSFEDYVGKIEIPSDFQGATKSGGTEMVVILDRSGSMGYQVSRIVKDILPSFLTGLGYEESSKITLLAFDNRTLAGEMSVSQLRTSPMRSGGSTYMSTAIRSLREYFMRKQPDKLRILSISDGALHDQIQTVNTASQLAKQVGATTINSQAIRFFTSSSQPDTRGLASVLQFNTIKQTNLVDIPSSTSDDIIVATMVSLFSDDGLDNSVTLTCDTPVVSSSPWGSGNNEVKLFSGENTLWFKELPGELSIGDIKVDIEMCSQLSDINFEPILRHKLDYYMDRLRILKVVNTKEATEEIEQIIQYFNRFQKWLEASNTDTVELLANTSLRGRMEYFRNVIKKRKETIFSRMREIANDDKVSQLTSAQQADYLRSSIDVTKNSKALAKRALKFGIDFTSIVHKEVVEMHKHLEELADIDDMNHLESFYSQETTVGGIRATCELVDQGMLEEMEVDDILQMINIVGVACRGTVGDYPDPMTWRVDELYSGCYISMSDVMMGYIQSGGSSLNPPGFPDKEITNVIPVFDDMRVLKFMKKYSPSLLEYSASVGMRRVITGIPMTHSYTMCAGIWKMIEILNKSKTTLNVETLVKMVNSYHVSIGSYFDFVMGYIGEQDPSRTYFIANNGLTNMIHPIYQILGTDKEVYLDKVLRSIYSYEVFRAIKRIAKDHERRDEFVKSTLYQLLGIDFDKHGTPLAPLFEEEGDVEHYNKYQVDEELLTKLTKEFWYANYVVLTPLMLRAAKMEDSVAYIQGLEELNEDMICREFKLPTSLRNYQLYTIVQALLYNNRGVRIDDDTEQMKIGDVGNPVIAEEMIKEWIVKQYRDDYTSRRVKKGGQEVHRLVELMIDELVGADIDEFVNIMKNGYTYRTRHHKIENTNSHGYHQLKERLLETRARIRDRIDKLAVLLLGTHQDEIVWNNGNVLFTPLEPFESFFNRYGEKEKWAVIKEEYFDRRRHVYRDHPEFNRHGHGNSRPSFWALGYRTLEEMIKSISHSDWMEYKKEHPDCCGIKRGML